MVIAGPDAVEKAAPRVEKAATGGEGRAAADKAYASVLPRSEPDPPACRGVSGATDRVGNASRVLSRSLRRLMVALAVNVGRGPTVTAGLAPDHDIEVTSACLPILMKAQPTAGQQPCARRSPAANRCG